MYDKIHYNKKKKEKEKKNKKKVQIISDEFNIQIEVCCKCGLHVRFQKLSKKM